MTRRSNEGLEVSDLRVEYLGGSRALHGVSLRVGPGQRVALLGANGAGKSTFARAISGTLPQFGGNIAGGSIVWNGEDATGWTARRAIRSGVAFIPEGRMLIPDMTIEENLELGAAAVERPAQEAWDRVYELFPVLAERRKQRAGLMSGGEQQMIAIGRALISEPSLIIADELSLGLAPKLFQSMLQALDKINQALETAVLLVEQNALASLRFADHAYVMQVGEIALSGSSKELLESPEVQDRYLGSSFASAKERSTDG